MFFSIFFYIFIVDFLRIIAYLVIYNIVNMKDKLDSIYIYIWEEFNTIYIGRTVNPKGRHYAHKNRESERTYQFSSEHGVEHPPMIIIENDLTLEEGVEREKYWINYYREDGRYEVLNKTNGGEIGGQLSTLTEEEKKEKRKKI